MMGVRDDGLAKGPLRLQLRELLPGVLGVARFRARAQHFLQFFTGIRDLAAFGVRHPEMVMVARTIRYPVVVAQRQGALKGIDCGTISTLLVVNPAESIGDVGRIRKSPASGLSKRECDVEIAARPEHHVRKIAGSNGIFAPYCQGFLVGISRFRPILASLVKLPE